MCSAGPGRSPLRVSPTPVLRVSRVARSWGSPRRVLQGQTALSEPRLSGRLGEGRELRSPRSQGFGGRQSWEGPPESLTTVGLAAVSLALERWLHGSWLLPPGWTLVLRTRLASRPHSCDSLLPRAHVFLLNSFLWLQHRLLHEAILTSSLVPLDLCRLPGKHSVSGSMADRCLSPTMRRDSWRAGTGAD